MPIVTTGPLPYNNEITFRRFIGSNLCIPKYDVTIFQNSSYLSFNQEMNFTDAPRQGVNNDSSLIGYWSMDEGAGSVAHDGSGNGNNGTITGAEWVDGKYGKALSIDAVGEKVTVPIPIRLKYHQASLFPLGFTFQPLYRQIEDGLSLKTTLFILSE